MSTGEFPILKGGGKKPEGKRRARDLGCIEHDFENRVLASTLNLVFANRKELKGE